MKSIKETVFENKVSVVFTVAFIFMLISAAIALALGQEILANKLAEVAYYFLVLAVIFQLIALVREERKVKSKSKEA